MLAKEYEFEVKEEPKDDDLLCSSEVVNLQTIRSCTGCAAKQKYIDSLKVENERLEAELRSNKECSDAQLQKIIELENALERTKNAHKTVEAVMMKTANMMLNDY